MNSVLSVRQAYEQGRDIYDDVKNFRKQDFHSESFCQVMQWLRECLMMHNLANGVEVESQFILQCREHQVIFESCVKRDTCKITAIRYQNEQNERENGRVLVNQNN